VFREDLAGRLQQPPASFLACRIIFHVAHESYPPVAQGGLRRILAESILELTFFI
jgi:hypothetical protein